VRVYVCLDRPLTVSHFRLLFCVVTSYVKFKDHSTYIVVFFSLWCWNCY